MEQMNNTGTRESASERTAKNNFTNGGSQGASTTGSGASTTGTGAYPPASPERTELANLAARLLLIGTTLINVDKSDQTFVLAGILNLTGGLLLRRAAVLESQEQQIAPGETTFANKLKLIGTAGGLFFSLILFWALLIEISLKQPTTGIAGTPTLAGASGSLFV
jgi:hypothetical protein